MDLINEAIVHAANAWWILPVVCLFCFIDGFLPILPSETLLVALGVVAASTGIPNVYLLILAGAAGAITGDQMAYLLGRRIGTERFGWMRRPRTQKLFAFARRELNVRGAMLIFTARYVPIGRVVVNLSSGATGFSHRRFTLLDVAGCLTWASYSVAIGVVAGAWFHDNQLLGIGLSVALAIVMGYLIDKLSHAILVRLGRRGAQHENPDAAGDRRGVEAQRPVRVPGQDPEPEAMASDGN
ncbi:DedA family protein [Paeniglutamicibacter psychrophenolicus]|uniref:Membrane protein DedA with SNARE-associated domain n=1 Tax=Paeniglutamicibacter psychrophenolicus TaxID=257454 RepID=A0ABS4WIG5_9MICC|nr:membrane protein DedA with SNARE-associated domain [Paeniglutamicibacter psychrophenolicus]